MSRYCDTCGMDMHLLPESKVATCCCCTVIAIQVEEHEKQLAALREENERLKRSIDSFGNGNDFDWNVLAKIDQLEQENERLRQDCRRLEYLTSIAHVAATADDQLVLRVDLQLYRNVTTIEKLDAMTTAEAIRHFTDQSIRDLGALSATSGESEE